MEEEKGDLEHVYLQGVQRPLPQANENGFKESRACRPGAGGLSNFHGGLASEQANDAGVQSKVLVWYIGTNIFKM